MLILSVILQSFLLVTMTFAGGSKLAGAKNFVEMFDSIKLPQWFRVVTGLVQLAGAVDLSSDTGIWQQPHGQAFGLASRCWWHASYI